MQETVTHNTQPTQQNWGLTSVMQYDVSNVFIHLGLDYQHSQPFQQHQPCQQPEQEDNDDEEEDPDKEEEDPDKEE